MAFISIEWISGRGDEADEASASDAARAVFDDAGVDAVAAQQAYEAQWEEFDDEAQMSGLALIWIEARNSADIAATQSWDKPDGGSVTINCWK